MVLKNWDLLGISIWFYLYHVTIRKMLSLAVFFQTSSFIRFLTCSTKGFSFNILSILVLFVEFFAAILLSTLTLYISSNFFLANQHKNHLMCLVWFGLVCFYHIGHQIGHELDLNELSQTVTGNQTHSLQINKLYEHINISITIEGQNWSYIILITWKVKFQNLTLLDIL